MKNLIKIELYKLRKGKSKYILFFSFLIMFIFSLIRLHYLQVERKGNFFHALVGFYDINYELVLPISIGIFTLVSICNEFNNKPIKNLIMSKYHKTSIILSKYITLFISTVVVYSITVGLYTLISYMVSDDSPIYLDYKTSTFTDIFFNIIQYNLIIIFYIASIIAFSLMLGLIFKKQGISILVYIISTTFLIVLTYYLETGGVTFQRYTFFNFATMDYLGVTGYTFSKLIDLIPAFSNSFLFLGISMIIFNKYQY